MRDILRERLPRRRDVLALGIGAFVVAAVPFAARARRRAYRLTLPVMGTVADMVVVDNDRARARAALAAAASELRRIDALMSRFSTRSDVGRLNTARRGTAVEITDETAHVIRESLAWAARTDGRFDPCLGSLSEQWSATAPDVTAYRDAHLFRALDLDRHRNRAVALLSRDEASLDLGGIAKGHAVDQALAAIRSYGIRDALVNAGGDLVARGASADGDPWRVGVRDPSNPAALCDTLDLRDEAVATSGDYETAEWRQGHDQRIHHLLDPRTAAPHATAAGTHSLTIVARDCLTADAAATALFGTLPGAETDQLLRDTTARIATRA